MKLLDLFRRKPEPKAEETRSSGGISFTRDWYRSEAGWGYGFHPEVGTTLPSLGLGITVNPYTVLQHPIVWQCVNLIANDVASIPLQKLTASTVSGTSTVKHERDVRHRVDRIFNERPNHYQTPFQFKRNLMHDVLLWGNFCALPVTDKFGQFALHPLPPSTTYLHEYEPGSQDFFIQTIYRNRRQSIPYDEVFHVSGLPGHHAGTSYGVGGIWGYSVTQILRDALGAGLMQQAHQNRTFANGGQPSGTIETEHERDPEGHSNLREEWEEVHNTPGKVAILWDGMKYNAIPMQSNHDAQLVELRKLDRELIASVFNLPVQKLNGLEFSSSSANVAEANKYYLYQTLTDWTLPIKQEAERKLFTTSEQLETINVPNSARTKKNIAEWDYQVFLREDRKTRFETYSTAIASRIMNPNECREEENLPPYPEGDEFENPNVQSGAESPPGDRGGENDEGGREQGSRNGDAFVRLNGHARN